MYYIQIGKNHLSRAFRINKILTHQARQQAEIQFYNMYEQMYKNAKMYKPCLSRVSLKTSKRAKRCKQRMF